MHNILLFVILFSLIQPGISQEADTSKTVKKSVLRSALIFPGVGQIKNKRYIKAGILFSLEMLAIQNFNENRLKYQNYQSTDPLPKGKYLGMRNKYAWWIGFIYFYSILDAIVDDHLSSFDEIMETDLDDQFENKQEKEVQDDDK